ncbi:hypothetical protein BDW59DRAFT_18535 [Aspergillus cavernicola]|uniref:Uncharacterized protein n=1 Tax=Aspergillus cavernicola TaxID=176166 RepID=A0ABR4IS08_9EURO
MSPSPQDEHDPHFSGYEGDISDQLSEANSVTSSTSDTTPKDSNNNDESRYGTIIIGCDLRTLREAGAEPELENTSDKASDKASDTDSEDGSEYGTIWIGCNPRELGLDDNHKTEDSDMQVEYVEDIGKLKDAEGSDADKSDDKSTSN